MPFESERQFKLWDYKVSHRQVLLRSPKTPEVSTNIDIVFWDVRYIASDTMLTGIVLNSGFHEDVTKVETETGVRFDASTIHRLTSGGKAFIVVAAGCKVLENEKRKGVRSIYGPADLH